MAAYFPRGQQSFVTIKRKFSSERQELHDCAAPLEAELYHLERITAILDRPAMAAVRKQFLGIDYDESARASQVEQLKDEVLRAERHPEAVQTGGDSICYAMLYNFDLSGSFCPRVRFDSKGRLHFVRRST
jgi:hypothetical protein